MGLCVDCKTEEAKYTNNKCKSCNTAYYKKYRQTKKYKEYQTKEYSKNRQKRLDYKKQYFQENKAERAAYMREWKSKNKDQQIINSVRAYISARLKDRKNNNTIYIISYIIIIYNVTIHKKNFFTIRSP